jgi:hypothetical protein
MNIPPQSVRVNDCAAARARNATEMIGEKISMLERVLSHF